MTMRPFLHALLLLALTVSAAPAEARKARRLESNLGQTMDRWMPAVVREEKLGGIGIAVIRHGHVLWWGGYGEQSPGVPVNRDTAFNTASIAKTVTAETALALAAQHRIDLDAPIAPLVASADLERDPLYQRLTPRLLLSHRSGLRNWPDDYADGKLAFDWAPGSRYRYSGAGVELAARYMEAKTGRRLRDLAAETLFRPWKIDRMAVGEAPEWTRGHLAQPVDAEGQYLDPAKLYPGLKEGTGLGAAYDLIATPRAYASFLERLIAASVKPSSTRSRRQTILTSLVGDERYGCEPRVTGRCPDRYGYAIGWQVQHYGRHIVLQHTGNDEGETDLVYFSPDRRTGAVIFINGANGWGAVVRTLDLIGDEPEVADYYRGLVEKLLNRRIVRFTGSKR